MQLSPTKLNYLQRCFICTWHFFVCETRVSVNFSLYQWRILCILRGVVFTVGCMCYDSFFFSLLWCEDASMFLSSRIATSTTTCRLQDRRHCFPVLDWSGTWLPGRGLSACRRRQRSPTSISRHSDLSLRTSNVFGDRCFAAASPRLRNLLPINLR